MSTFSQLDCVIALARRRLNIPSGLSVPDLQTLIENDGPIDALDLAFIKAWLSIPIEKEVLRHYENYSASQLAEYVSFKTNRKFPFPTTYLPDDSNTAKTIILAYYLGSHDPIIFPSTEQKTVVTSETKQSNTEQKITTSTPESKQWTAEQEKAITSTDPIVVINAGPGTGKTTVANQRAYQLRREGVLLLSYTNAAIDENYKRLEKYPELKGIIGKKNYGKQLTVTTVDSIASYIVDNQNRSESYILNVRSAIERVHEFGKSAEALESLRRGLPYQHIIVDEAQDIDDPRGELLFTLFSTLQMKSFCVFGDPRQRLNSAAGGWYSRMWINSISPLNDPISVTKIGLSISHRFQNPELLTVCNDLSVQRPKLHHPLSLPLQAQILNIDRIDVLIASNETHMIELAIHIRDVLHIESKVPYSEIAMIGPSFWKDNKTSQYGLKMCAVFKDQGIPCCIDSEFCSEGVQFSTIHRAKGKEFDVVILFGIANFPDSFPMIPYSDAESLIYVMNTRARRKMYYVLRMASLPRGIEVCHLTNSTFFEMQDKGIRHCTDRFFPIRNMVSDFGFLELLDSNQYTVGSEPGESFEVNLPSYPTGTNPRWWGIACGIGVQMYLRRKLPDSFLKFIGGDHIVISKTRYQDGLRKGKIVNGIDQETSKLVVSEAAINGIRPDELDQCRNIRSTLYSKLSWNQFVLVVTICDFLSSGNMLDRYEIIEPVMPKNLFTLFEDIAVSLITRFGNCVAVEHNVKMNSIRGSIDAVCFDPETDITYIIEFKTGGEAHNYQFSKEDQLQVWCYARAMTDANFKCVPVLINLVGGTCEMVTSPYHHEGWVYLIDAFTQIKIQVDLTHALMNHKWVTHPILPGNLFCVGAKFYPPTSHLFDLAAINIDYPYRSIVTALYIPCQDNQEVTFATEHLQVKKELFTTARSLEEIKKSFRNVSRIISEVPGVTCYTSLIDDSWCPETKRYDLQISDSNASLKFGSVRQIGLLDLYKEAVLSLEVAPHLKESTALSDALMLYTLLKMGIVTCTV